MIEVAIGTALSGLVIYGGYSVATSTSALSVISDGQSVLDREMAAGTQIANNVIAIKPYIQADALGDCLIQHQSGNCARFANGWHLFPSITNSRQAPFNVAVAARGLCDLTDPKNQCLVTRTMEYRWLCSEALCSGLETKISVAPVNSLVNKIKAREVTIKHDRRQFLSRGQLAFLCDASSQSMVGVDYDQLRDLCEAKAESRCELPNRTYHPGGGATDCQDELRGGCGEGFTNLGLASDSVQCVPAAGGRTVASGSSGTSTATSVTTNPTPLSTVTITSTEVATVTQTSTNSSGTTGTTTTTTENTSGSYWKYTGNAGCPSALGNPNSGTGSDGPVTWSSLGQNATTAECNAVWQEFYPQEGYLLVMARACHKGATCSISSPGFPPDCFLCK